ncbi:hypothetical protein CAPTEDRAFT_153089 [Capitella teleta]|uniref:EF-hand domain-containing protein n=1 Tax=Capitella teleta TaxID=283909 RepID=R7VH00_CAPTE|nr:hypothetical protein CAPTEDRAFT_153089 [Capitella teleta]|eukprot:ELU14970.1 hypothetical protein CAPTEDRAFT_153089 [Capitella teleta]
MPVAQTRLETLQVCKLLQCVREEDRTQVEKLINNGVPHLINYNEPGDGETALNIAAVANNEEITEFLLNLGAHPDVADFKGRTAVMRAAEFGHVQCIEKLAKAGCDMKMKDYEGKGVIFYCISNTQRHAKCLEIALAHGAEVNTMNKDGIPVFLHACETAAQNEDMCMMLLQHNADPNSKNEKNKRTALMAAAASGSAQVVRAILEKGAEVNEIMMRTKIHACHEAAKGGFLDCLQVMSAFGANFDQYTDQGDTPCHLAAAEGHAMCIKFLAQRGCNPKTKNAEGNQPKAVAKDNGHKDATKEAKKAEKIFGKSGKNNEPWAIALYDFCYAKEKEFLKTFQKFDADGTGFIMPEDFSEILQNAGAPMPHESDMKKTLQLHDKGKDAGVDFVEFLNGKKYINKAYLMSAFEDKKKKKKKGGGKKKKGKTKIPMPICTNPAGPRTEDGGPPEMYIRKHIHFTDTGRFDRDKPPGHPLEDDSAWYLHHPEKTYINICDASKHQDIDTLKDALINGTPIDTRDKYYKTPLMVACSSANMEVVHFLIENGATVNATDNFKWTPLHFAAHAGLLDVVDYLLVHGADLEAKTMNLATPLMRAIESSKPEVVQYFIDKGAKIQIENRKGQTPMDIATSWSDPRVYDIVKAKWDTLPPMNDKKKGGKGGKAPPKKRPNSGGPSSGGKVRPGATTNEPDSQPARQRKGSILRAASALAGGLEEEEDITYHPLKTWTQQPTTQKLLCEREVRRKRFTWEVDFEDFKMPFLKNVANRCEEQGGFDDDD